MSAQLSSSVDPSMAARDRPPPSSPVSVGPSPAVASPHTARSILSAPGAPHTGPVAPPVAAGGAAGFAPPPYSERPTYSTPRQLTFAHAASVATGGHVELPAPPERKRRSFLEPLELPSPFAKAPKSRVSNFREGLREGGLGAWAEIREGVKGPVGLTWYWAKEGGAIGALNGLGYGTAILALCPISASIAFLNHSSRGAIRGVRSANEKRRSKKSSSISSSIPSTQRQNSNPLSMDRTATMESAVSTRSRRSRVGNLLSRVTSTRSASIPITPLESSTADSSVAEGSHGRITPFTPTTPLEVSRSGVLGKQREPTRLELDTKWGSPTSPHAGPSGSGSGSRALGRELPPRADGINQIELDTKWGTSALPPLLPPSDPIHPLELDTKWGSSALPPLPLDPPHLPHAWGENAEAGPSTRGTPQLETDIKWPMMESPVDQLPALAERSGGGWAGVASTAVAREEDRPPKVEETSDLEMQLKWEKEMARAGSG